MGRRGIEPQAYWLRVSCSADWANGPLHARPDSNGRPADSKSDALSNWATPTINFATRLARLERATYGLEVRCSIQLSYRRNLIVLICYEGLRAFYFLLSYPIATLFVKISGLSCPDKVMKHSFNILNYTKLQKKFFHGQMKSTAARPQGIKFEIRKYTDIRHSCESRNPEKKTGFRIKCGMTEIQ